MSPLLANAGLPMISKAWPAAWVLLIPVILVEAVVAWCVFRSRNDDGLVVGLAAEDSLILSIAANVASTIVGIPLGWLAMYLLIVVAGPSFDTTTPTGRLRNATLGSPVLPVRSGIDEQHLGWMVPAAGASLCLPFFLASVGIEGFVASLFVRREDRFKAWRWAVLANLATYVPIALGLVVLSIRAARIE